MIPTPENPFLFEFDGTIPALKNSHTADFHTDPAINKWYAMQAPKVLAQRAAQSDLDDIPEKTFAYCVFEYFYPKRLPKGDLDNCYTTVQELLQKPSPDSVLKKHKGILNVVPNDKQVCTTHSVCLPLGGRPVVGAYLWVWQDVEDMHHVQQLVLWNEFRSVNLSVRMKKQTFPSIFRR